MVHRRSSIRNSLVVLLITSSLVMTTKFAYPGEIAIIVNKKNPTDDLAFKDLVKIFKQEKQYWKGGKRIYLILQETGSPEKNIALKTIYKMDDKELKKFWLKKLFRGEISSYPKTLNSNKAVKLFTSKAPNAIGFINTSFIDKSIKVLRIDGHLPGDKKYPLRDVALKKQASKVKK